MKHDWSHNNIMCRCCRIGFTLIELLIVIGLLGALASLLLSNLRVTRTEVLDDSIVEKELSDIQRAFQRFAADCLLNQDDYKLIAKYGLAPLMKLDGYLVGSDVWSFPDKWNPAKNKGWCGPYLQQEGERTLEIDGTNKNLPVLLTPYAQKDGDAYYYRVIRSPSEGTINQLYVIAPASKDGNVLVDPGNEEFKDYKYKRKLLLNGQD